MAWVLTLAFLRWKMNGEGSFGWSLSARKRERGGSMVETVLDSGIVVRSILVVLAPVCAIIVDVQLIEYCSFINSLKLSSMCQ